MILVLSWMHDDGPGGRGSGLSRHQAVWRYYGANGRKPRFNGGNLAPAVDIVQGRPEPVKAVCNRRATASVILPSGMNVHGKTALTEPARKSRSRQLSGAGTRVARTVRPVDAAPGWHYKPVSSRAAARLFRNARVCGWSGPRTRSASARACWYSGIASERRPADRYAPARLFRAARVSGGRGVLAERAVRMFSPDVLLCVGVAGALKDDLELGDIVVGTRIAAYHGGTAAEDFLARPRTWEADHRLEQLARHLDMTGDWREWLPGETQDALPAVHFRPIAAGEVVLDSRTSQVLSQLHLHYNDVAAIEMEGAGLAHAAHLNHSLPALVVRGISDRADGTKTIADRGGWQERASANAAAFAVSLLSNLSLAATPYRTAADAPTTAAQMVRAAGSGAAAAVKSDSREERPVPPQPDDNPADDPFDGWARFAVIDHETLFGIDDITQKIGRLLHNPDGDWIISVFGPGGAGKTTLAYEAVKRYAGLAGFRRIAWISAKFTHITSLGNIARTQRAVIDWRDILSDITRQLRLDVDINPALIERNLASALAALNDSQRCLIVIDNLETVRDARLVLEYLEKEEITRPHKVILTTRHSAITHSQQLVRELAWNGLSRQAARDYAEYLVQDDPGLSLSSRDVDDMTAASGCLPLLIKLIIRLATFERQPIKQVVDRLQNRNAGLGGDVGSYLYEESLSALESRVGTDAAVNLMNVFCCKTPGESFSSEEFYMLSRLPDHAAFDQVKAAACQLALVRTLDGNTRFTVHPLLREFICGDAVG